MPLGNHSSPFPTMRIEVQVDNLPHGIWERIAFYTLVSAETFLGPPSNICSMVLISRSINRQISHKTNTSLYARIFRFKFDYAAPARRLSERWRTTGCLASELIKRFRALKRIKSMEFNMDDLWTIYLMMIENDGRNESQLLDYAMLGRYLQSLIIYRTTPDAQELAWFRNSVVDSLVIWLLWLTGSEESIRCEDSRFRQYILGILHSLIVTGHRHSSVYAPDIFFTLPLCSDMEPSALDAIQIHPSIIQHYSHDLHLKPPVIAPAVIMALVARAQSAQNTTNIPPHRHDIPLTRVDAVLQGHTGPTVADILDFHLRNRIPLVSKCGVSLDIYYPEDLDEGLKADENDDDVKVTVDMELGSCRHDVDWTRLVSCYDPRLGDIPLRGVVYKLGSMSGSWEGRLLQCDLDLLTSLQAGSTTNPNLSSISVRHHPLYWQLEEHHCLSPNDPVSLGIDDNSFDDILNAWLPRGVTFSHEEDAVSVYDPLTGKTSRYETVIPRNAALYSKEEKQPRSWISEESDEAIAENPNSVFDSTNPDISLTPGLCIDNDNEYCDTVSHLSSGITDILITGKTGDTYGDAWGHYTIYGRVRPWDGLVSLLRIPSDPSEEHLGKWIFKGYLHDQNFVGRWRETSTPVELVGYEGGFVVHKTDYVEHPN